MGPISWLHCGPERIGIDAERNRPDSPTRNLFYHFTAPQTPPITAKLDTAGGLDV